MLVKSVARKGRAKPVRAEPDSLATDSELDAQEGISLFLPKLLSVSVLA